MNTITPQTTDEELMRLYLQASIPAFNELYSRHAGKLLGYLRKKVDAETAEELLQEVFARLHKSKWTYKDEYSFLPWIFTITRNILLDHYKKAENKVASNSAELSSEFVDETTTSTADSIDLSALLEALPPAQRRIFERRYINDWSFDQISAETSLSAQNIRQIISRGLKKLKVVATKQESES